MFITQSGLNTTVFETEYGRRRNFVFSRLSNFARSAVTAVCRWSSVPNLIQISLIMPVRSTQFCSRRSFDDVTKINFRFLCVAVVHLPVKFGANIFIQSTDRNFRKFIMAAATVLGFLQQVYTLCTFRHYDSSVHKRCIEFRLVIS